MNDYNLLHTVIQDRIHSPGANYYGPFWWEKEISAFCSDILLSVHFIKEECTDEELYWLSEVFEEIVEKSHSTDFLRAVRERAQLVKNAEWRADILSEVKDAEAYL